ncbi:MAG: Hsp20/alpha crystallin family protein [Candidatus Zixiibacteriota bacterium]|nr:MAG: Hsp20/alpha crystallin family protein [candidate division Zixibacteria bacterium]
MRNLVVRPNRIAREIDSFFNDFFGSPRFYVERDSDFVPRVDIVDSEENVTMRFEVPGMDKDNFKISVKDKVLSVSGERKSETEEKGKNFIRTEIRSGSFCRSFTLPETIDSEKVKADYKNGILELTLAKREEAKPKEIEVKVS